MHRRHQYFVIQDALSRKENSSCPDIPPIRCLLHAMPRNTVYALTKVTRINATTECVLPVNSARSSRAQ